MPQPEHEPPVAAVRPPRADGEVAAAVALLEAAALTAALRWVASWRTDPSKQAADLRLAVLVAEATIRRCLAEDGYLSARQLSLDLRHAAAWLAAGARFGG